MPFAVSLWSYRRSDSFRPKKVCIVGNRVGEPIERRLPRQTRGTRWFASYCLNSVNRRRKQNSRARSIHRRRKINFVCDVPFRTVYPESNRATNYHRRYDVLSKTLNRSVPKLQASPLIPAYPSAVLMHPVFKVSNHQPPIRNLEHSAKSIAIIAKRCSKLLIGDC